jgi:hypothetical protein
MVNCIQTITGFGFSHSTLIFPYISIPVMIYIGVIPPWISDKRDQPVQLLFISLFIDWYVINCKDHIVLNGLSQMQLFSGLYLELSWLSFVVLKFRL